MDLGKEKEGVIRKAMNYNEFLKAVDEKLSIMSETKKNQWIHDLARTTKEHERIAFLNSLQGEKQTFSPVISIVKERPDPSIPDNILVFLLKPYFYVDLHGLPLTRSLYGHGFLPLAVT